ncbi:hypothetical protein F5878DRAFT_616803 [Lentinula raphanica]|uniref:Zn(2)-C6 fungal-type domain-containing protein n=1 Tax=Lentinula raphanica TaxID=153919 RepID=A0AA38PB05_9AGAR|nr:hypothetical protein F5878DRAFT_616803 [Lentinula raphanica]
MTSSISQRPHTPPGAGTSRPLKRGKACLTCRFLKIRCDGARPICGPCQRTPKDDPCEYADGPGRSRTRALEETVSRLEARLREYEHPEETPPVALHDPYEHGLGNLGHESDSTIRIKVARPSSSYSTHSSPSSPFSVSSSLGPLPSPRPGGSSGSSERKSSASPAGEPRIPLPATRNLLEWFFTHALSFGFFLNIPRFTNSALLPLDFGHQSRPCPGLLSTVYLWGIHLSPQTQHKDLEHTLLVRALRDTASDLSTSNPHPHRFMHTIQAETLLAYYFFRNGRILEAKRHSSSAASLVLGCGLNTLRSSQQQGQWASNSISASVPDGWIRLPPSQDAIEEGERINAFWTVFTLYRDLAVAVDPPRSVCGVFDAPGCRIDTPWPLDMDIYKKNVLPPRGTSTVHDYLNHIQQREDEHQLVSTLNVVTKASLLLHQASFVAGQYYTNMPARDAQTLFAAFQSVQHLLNSLRTRMSPLEEINTGTQSVSTVRAIHLAHCLIHGSIIRLNETFAETDVDCRQTCVKSAQAMIHGGGLNVAEFGCVNPIMGTLWALACQTLDREVLRLRSMRSDAHLHAISEMDKGDLLLEREDSLLTSLQQGLSALTFFSTNSALMSKSFPCSTLSSPRFPFCDSVVTVDDVQQYADADVKAKEGMVNGESSLVDSKSWYSCPPAWDHTQLGSMPSSSSIADYYRHDNIPDHVHPIGDSTMAPSRYYDTQSTKSPSNSSTSRQTAQPSCGGEMYHSPTPQTNTYHTHHAFGHTGLGQRTVVA